MVDWSAAMIIALVGVISVFLVLGTMSIIVTLTGLLVNRAAAFQKKNEEDKREQTRAKG